MIWRIFKKDWTLLWPLVALVAATHVIKAILWLVLGFFEEPRVLVQMANIFSVAVFLGIAALIVTVVHQDALPGDRQDWLVRPIRRRDLILEKLLFVLVAVSGPMFLVDVVHCMAAGFSFWESVSAALSRGIYSLLAFNIPVLGLAALTSTFVEAVGGFLAACVIVVVIRIGVVAGNPANATTFATMSNGWMMLNLWTAVALTTAAAVILLQYFRRMTRRARAIAFGAVLILPLTAFIPWSAAFSLLQLLSADPAAARPVAIAFNPSLGKITLQPGTPSRANSVWLPLQVSGLLSNSVILNDRANIRIVGRDGATLYRGLTIGDPQTANGAAAGPQSVNDLPVRTATGGDVQTHQLINLPHRVYELVRSQPVRIELDYSLTLFHIGASDTIPALNGDKRIANLGLCKTNVDDEGDDVQISCLQTGPEVTCATFVLENTVNRRRNPPSSFCNKDYPLFTARVIPNAMLLFGGELHFRDPQGLAKYPVDSAQLADARVAVKTYMPIAHFTRHLTIPEIRLGDWEATARVASAGTLAPR